MRYGRWAQGTAAAGPLDQAGPAPNALRTWYIPLHPLGPSTRLCLETIRYERRHNVLSPPGPSTSDASANWELAGCLRRRRLAFPTGKVARPLAVTDESQNAAYFLQPNWNGSIVHLTAHKQSRFQLTRLAARATLPAREGKCALRAQDAHLYKSQFAKASLVEGPRGCYGRNQRS